MLMSVFAYLCEPRCLATFGLTPRSNIDETRISGVKWDVYSLAVVISFLFRDQHPYSGLRDAEIVHGVVEDGLRPETVCGGVRAFVCDCPVLHPSLRLDHP